MLTWNVNIFLIERLYFWVESHGLLASNKMQVGLMTLILIGDLADCKYIPITSQTLRLAKVGQAHTRLKKILFATAQPRSKLPLWATTGQIIIVDLLVT